MRQQRRRRVRAMLTRRRDAGRCGLKQLRFRSPAPRQNQSKKTRLDSGSINLMCLIKRMGLLCHAWCGRPVRTRLLPKRRRNQAPRKNVFFAHLPQGCPATTLAFPLPRLCYQYEHHRTKHRWQIARIMHICRDCSTTNLVRLIHAS